MGVSYTVEMLLGVRDGNVLWVTGWKCYGAAEWNYYGDYKVGMFWGLRGGNVLGVMENECYRGYRDEMVTFYRYMEC